MMHAKGGLHKKLLRITVIPLLIASVIITLCSYVTFYHTMQREVQRGLKSVAAVMLHSCEQMYPGDYRLVQDGDVYQFYKGEQKLTGNYDYIDSIKRDTGIDVTFFFYDTRAITTLTDANGKRIIGSLAHPKVVRDVLENKQERFYDKVLVNGNDFFAYYAPVYNSDGTCVGMVFAGKPSDTVRQEILIAVSPILVIAFIMIIMTIVVCGTFTKELVGVIAREKGFLRDISNGNLKAELDPRIMNREDELGEMGRFTVHVQKFLKEMIERDMLTGLYSRRIGENKLEQLQEKSLVDGTMFCVAIGDIDFFKNFNDEYGHDCGDMVLKGIGDIFNHEMVGRGFAVRWGGEEFLIIYENRTLEEAIGLLEDLKQKLCDQELVYQEKFLQITMTFGITQGSQERISSIIKEADKRLYHGKMNGRNCIISE